MRPVNRGLPKFIKSSSNQHECVLLFVYSKHLETDRLLNAIVCPLDSYTKKILLQDDVLRFPVLSLK